MMFFFATIKQLRFEIDNYKKDGGYTKELLSAIQNVTNHSLLCDSLIKNSPLSDSVLVEFLKNDIPPGEIPPGHFKNVMFANLDLTEKTAQAYLAKSLPSGIRSQIDERIKNHSPFVPGLTEFEKLFPNYVSHRKILCDQELIFLMNGGDPESSSNPRYNTTLDLIEATLFNQYLEVMIDKQIIKLLPNKEKNVIIKNSSAEILNYIRQHGDIPIYTPPSNEPPNGIAISEAPPIVDPNIIVQPTNIYNVDCGGIEIGTSPTGGAERVVTYTTNSTGDNLLYYWNFGDGFASYQKNPSHSLVGTEGVFTTTLTIYNSSTGAPCGGGYSYGGLGSGTGSSGSTQACATGNLYATPVAGFNSNINIYFNFANYVTNTPVTYQINYGDGNTATGSFFGNGWHSLNHGYPLNNYTSYNITVLLIYNTTGCTMNLNGTIAYSAPNPPSSNCCDKRDREKETWVNPDNNHKFNHKLKLSNIFGFGGKFSADVNTYYKINLGITTVWTPDWASGCVDLTGHYWSPCTTSGDACSGSKIALSQGPNCGGAPNHGISWSTGACYYYITTNGMGSNGSAYGGSSFITIGNCD